MTGYEHLEQDGTVQAEHRLSWLAYVRVVFTFLLMVAISVGIGWWALNEALTDRAFQAGIVASGVVLLSALALFIYKVLYLKSIYLYTDASGVWIHSGILPWSKGTRGVKWRDIEDAVYYPGFVSWLFRSYTVRIGHRFTKTSEIFVYHLAQGNKVVEQINTLHQSNLAMEPQGAL